MQNQTSNTLHNAIMEAGSKDRPPMLAPGNYVQWKSRIKRYIETKPNHELIHYCLKNPPYGLSWTEKQVLISEGSLETRTKKFQETYKNVSQDIRDQLNVEAEAVQIILTGIDNDIYSTVDACHNVCEMWKAIERLKHGESINVQDLETNLFWEFGKFTSQDEWQRFMTLVKQSQELKTVSYHKLYDILKQHQNEVNEIKAEKIARVANPLALVSQQQPVYNPQNHPTHYTQNSATRSQQVTTSNRGKAIVNSLTLIYDQEPFMVAEDDEMSKDKEIDKLMALISLSFKKIYKPTNNNLQTSSNTNRANKDNSPRINRGPGYENQRLGHVAGAREAVEQADWKDDTDDEFDDQELEAHYMYMAKLQEVTLDAADNSGPIFDTESVQEVQPNDNYNVFAIESEHHEQSESIHDTYSIEQDEHNVIIDSLDMSYDREQIDQNDDDNDLANKREIEDFKNKNKSLESSNNHFKEAINKLLETNKLLYDEFKKSQAELKRRDSMEYASEVELECAKVRGDFISYKMESQKSFTKYTHTINDLNQTISEMKNKLSAHQETLSILTQQKEAQIKLYKSREDKELDKVIALENKVKVLDNIVYKTGQSVRTMNMLNSKCRTSFAKPEFLKKAQRMNPRMYDIGCYNDNPALMLAPESDEMIHLEKESRSKLSSLIRPFDYEKLNNLYDLFVPQREKSSEQRYFSERSRLSHTAVNNGNSKESFNKQTTLLEKRMDESIPLDKQCKSSIELFKVNTLSQISTRNSKTQFLNEIDRLSREYYYADHMNAILGVYIELDEVTNLQCDYGNASKM
nr:hypothetical protein [Tanacetum cinerariifolium]